MRYTGVHVQRYIKLHLANVAGTIKFCVQLDEIYKIRMLLSQVSELCVNQN